MLSIKTYLGAAAIAAMVDGGGRFQRQRMDPRLRRIVTARQLVFQRFGPAAPAGPATTTSSFTRRARQHHHQHRLDHLRRRLLHASGTTTGPLAAPSTAAATVTR